MKELPEACPGCGYDFNECGACVNQVCEFLGMDIHDIDESKWLAYGDAQRDARDER